MIDVGACAAAAADVAVFAITAFAFEMRIAEGIGNVRPSSHRSTKLVSRTFPAESGIYGQGVSSPLGVTRA